MVIDKFAKKLTNPPLWPHGFFVANFLFAVVAIASILTLIHDQRLAARAAKLQERNFQKYREDFDKATFTKVRLLKIIARKLSVPEHVIQETIKPLPPGINQ